MQEFAELPVDLFKQQIPPDKAGNITSVKLSQTIITCKDLIKKKVIREDVYSLAAVYYHYKCPGIPLSFGSAEDVPRYGLIC